MFHNREYIQINPEENEKFSKNDNIIGKRRQGRKYKGKV